MGCLNLIEPFTPGADRFVRRSAKGEFLGTSEYCWPMVAGKGEERPSLRGSYMVMKYPQEGKHSPQLGFLRGLPGKQSEKKRLQRKETPQVSPTVEPATVLSGCKEYKGESPNRGKDRQGELSPLLQKVSAEKTYGMEIPRMGNKRELTVYLQTRESYREKVEGKM